MIKIINLNTKDKVIKALIRVGNRLAHCEAKRWEPCISDEAIEWSELVKAYKVYSDRDREGRHD